MRLIPAPPFTGLGILPEKSIQNVPAPQRGRKLFQRPSGCSPDSGLDPGTVMGFSFQESPMPFLTASRRFILA